MSVRNVRSQLNAAFVALGQGVAATMTYRLAFFQSIISECISFAGIAAYWSYAASTTSAKYSRDQILIYFAGAWLIQLLQFQTSTYEISTDIRMGKLNYSLIRPFPYLMSSAVRSAAHTLFYAVALLPIVGLIFYFWLPFSEIKPHLGSFALAMMLAFILGELVRTSVGLLAFQMTQIWGPATLLVALHMASGTGYPPDLLSEPYKEALTYLPTYYTIGFPLLILLGRLSDGEIALQAARGAGFVVLLTIVVAWQWRRGVKSFEAVGI